MRMFTTRSRRRLERRSSSWSFGSIWSRCCSPSGKSFVRRVAEGAAHGKAVKMASKWPDVAFKRYSA